MGQSRLGRTVNALLGAGLIASIGGCALTTVEIQPTTEADVGVLLEVSSPSGLLARRNFST